MENIRVEKPEKEKLEQMGVFSWPIWQKEASTFPWHYSDRETCFLLEGKVKVTPEGGGPSLADAGIISRPQPAAAS